MAHMYGLTRGAATLIGIVVAGFLIWLGTDALVDDVSRAEFWWAVLMFALAGFVIALSQLLGGWTKWGWPRISLNVFLLGFVPALIVGGWALLYAQPGDGTMAGDIRDWSTDLGIDGLMDDLTFAFPAIAFAIGLVFGLTFDTTGPVARDRRGDVVPVDTTDDREAVPDTDERRVRIREGAHSD